MKPRVLLAILPALVAVFGCRGPTGYDGASLPRIETPNVRERLTAAVRGLWPDSAHFAQRLLLTARGRRFEMVAFSNVDRANKRYRLKAFGEMGGLALDLAWDKGHARVIAKPGGMPESFLVEGLMRDLAALYLPLPSDMTPVPARESATVTVLLVERPGDDANSAWRFRENAASPSDALWSENGRLIRRMTFADYRTFPDCPRPLPTTVSIDNPEWRCEVRLETLKCLPTRTAAREKP